MSPNERHLSNGRFLYFGRSCWVIPTDCVLPFVLVLCSSFHFLLSGRKDRKRSGETPYFHLEQIKCQPGCFSHHYVTKKSFSPDASWKQSCKTANDILGYVLQGYFKVNLKISTRFLTSTSSKSWLIFKTGAYIKSSRNAFSSPSSRQKSSAVA